jgi:hypothetical protein
MGKRREPPAASRRGRAAEFASRLGREARSRAKAGAGAAGVPDPAEARSRARMRAQAYAAALGTQRRLEARIGQLLLVEQGKRTDKLPSHDEEVGFRGDEKAAFRHLARALDGEVVLTADEWRP